MNKARVEAVSSLLFTSGAIAYTLSFVVALVNAYACLAFHAMLAVYYALDPVGRRASRRGSSSAPPS